MNGNTTIIGRNKMKINIIGAIVCLLVITSTLPTTATANEQPNINIGQIIAINSLRLLRAPRVVIEIENNGNTSAYDVNVNINVRNRRFQRLNLTTEENIETIPAGGQAFISFSLSWLGQIQITVTAGNDTEVVNGRVFFGKILRLNN